VRNKSTHRTTRAAPGGSHDILYDFEIPRVQDVSAGELERGKTACGPATDSRGWDSAGGRPTGYVENVMRKKEKGGQKEEKGWARFETTRLGGSIKGARL